MHVHTKTIDTCTASDSDVFYSIVSCLFDSIEKIVYRKEKNHSMFYNIRAKKKKIGEEERGRKVIACFCYSRAKKKRLEKKKEE